MKNLAKEIAKRKWPDRVSNPAAVLVGLLGSGSTHEENPLVLHVFPAALPTYLEVAGQTQKG